MKICKKFLRLVHSGSGAQVAFNTAVPLKFLSLRSAHMWTEDHMPWLASGRAYPATLGRIAEENKISGMLPTDVLGYNAAAVMLFPTRSAPLCEIPGRVTRAAFNRFELGTFVTLSGTPEADEDWDTPDCRLLIGIPHTGGIDVAVEHSAPISLLDIPELQPCFAPGELIRAGASGPDADMSAVVHAMLARLGASIADTLHAAIVGPYTGPAVLRSSIAVSQEEFDHAPDNFHLWELTEPCIENYRQMLAGRIPTLRSAF